jgi:hypothetical protein
MAQFENPTAEDFDAVTLRSTARMKRQLLAISARYDRRTARVMLTLNNDAVVGFQLSVFARS